MKKSTFKSLITNFSKWILERKRLLEQIEQLKENHALSEDNLRKQLEDKLN